MSGSGIVKLADVVRKSEAAKQKKVAGQAANSGLNLRVPTIKKIQTITADQEAFKKAKVDMRQYLADIPGHMMDLVSRIHEIQKASPEERAIRFDEFEQLKAEMAAHLWGEKEPLRRAAGKAYDIALMSVSADISLSELLNGKLGCVFMNIPDMNGKRFFSGGLLLVESDSRVVKPLKVGGGFREIMDEVIKGKVFIPIWSLSSGHFNGPVMSEEKFRLCRIFHAIMRRGMAEAQNQEQKKGSGGFAELSPV